jgi:heptose-I-phosphate ethanolaminephosphotransferase
MWHKLNKSPRFWLWFYITLLLLPSAVISGDGLGKALYPTVFFLALINHYRRFFWLSLFIYLLCPLALYYELSYHVPPETSLWLTLLGSSSTEAGAYLTHVNGWLAAGLMLPYLLLVPVFYRKLPAQSFTMPWMLRLAFLALIYVPVHRFYEEKDHLDGYLSLYRHYKQSFPLNYFMGYPAAKIEIARVKALVSTQSGMQCAADPGLAGQPQTLVLVIGESARRDRQGIFGYKVDTTPELAKRRDQLWLFDNALSASFETTSSLPTLLTGHLQDDEHNLHPSFLSAFRSAGFKTYWYSNQAQYGEFDSLISAYASEAKERVFLHQHSYSISLTTIYDEALLPYLDQALADKSVPKKLIVVHLYGSHADFGKRYPESFKRFADTYDNSILYTDHVLGQIINRVEAAGGQSALLYMSDHGLNLSECPTESYHLDIKSDYEVPLLAWATKDWRAANPRLVQRLGDAQHAPLTSETVMPALLTMGHLTCPTMTQEHSLFNPEVSKTPRYVHTFAGNVPYDSSSNNAQCHLVPAARK